jgi:BED zinc finger
MDAKGLDRGERDVARIRRQFEEVGATVDCISPSNSQSPSIVKEEHSLSLSANFGNGNQPSKSRGTSTTSRVRSNVWDYYSIVEEKGLRFAVCKQCAKKLKQAKSAGTGTLRNHFLAHAKEKSAGSGGSEHQTTMAMFHGRHGPSSTFYSPLDAPIPSK